MVDIESPYQPPAASQETIVTSDRPADADGGFLTQKFASLPLLGGFVGFGGYIVAASLLEARNEPLFPTLSYGQEAGLISLPLCTMIAAAIGFGVALARARRYFASIIMLVLVWYSGSAIVNSIWNNQIARYGRDPSEIVLYWPPLAFSLLALVAAAGVALVAVVRWWLRASG